MTSRKLIDRCADALGGYDVIHQIEIIYVKAVYPDHGDTPREFIMKRPNKSYNPIGNIVFDGEKICLLNGRDGESDPEFAPEEEWKDGEVEIGYHFPAFFEYPSDYMGIEVVDGNEFHTLKVDLPLGANLTYFVDVETYLPSRVKFEFKLGEREIDDWRDVWNYKEVDGFRYPFSFTYMSRTGRQEGMVQSIEINPPVSDDLFKIPVIFR